MDFPYGDTITLHSRAVTSQDAYGDDVYTSTDSTLVGAYYDAGSTEVVQGVDTVTTTPTVILPAGTVVNPVDQITVRAVTYDVDGRPQDWRHPMTGWQPGIVVRLRGVTG